jgi:ribosomal protein S18 acetylase RimI-like enzyme
VSTTTVERLTGFFGSDLDDLCDATDAAIIDGIGFTWIQVPPRERLETYWRGVLVVPERELFVCRVDGTIAGSAQLVKPTPHNEAGAFTASLTTHFIAPWTRGYGLATALLVAVENAAKSQGYSILKLNVRETQEAAIQLYQKRGYVRWGTMPYFAKVEGGFVAGHYYYKELK